MIKFSQFVAEKKKETRDSIATTATSSPLKGQNQDQSGYSPSHSTADYTISDSKKIKVKEGFVSGVGAVRQTPVTMKSAGGTKAQGGSHLQHDADRRRVQLDKVAQQRRDEQEKERQRQQQEREKAAAARQKEAERALKPGSVKEEVELDEGFNKTKPAHVAARKTVGSMGALAHAEYHDDGSATVHTKGNKNVSSARVVDHHHDIHGLGYNRPEKTYNKYSRKKGGLTHLTKKTGENSHEIHIKEEVELDEVSKKTLGSYIAKAGKEAGYSGYRIGYQHGKEVGQGKWGPHKAKDVDKDAGEEEKYERNQRRKRMAGLAMAGRKIAKEEVELQESHAELNKHISDFSKGVKSSAAKQSTYKRDNKPIHNMKHVETDSDHQKVFNHLKKMGYKKTSGYDPHPNGFDMHYNHDSMTTKSDPVHHASGISAHVEQEHGGKLKVHFTHRGIKEETLDEARRGRPPKNKTAEDPGSDNIIMQLRKVITLRGQAPVTFVDGRKANISPGTAHRLLAMYDNLKTSAEKHTFSQRIHKSADSMRDVIAGKKEIAKPKISLGGSYRGK